MNTLGKRMIISGVIPLMVGLFFWTGSVSAPGLPSVTVETADGSKLHFTVEVAATPGEQVRGLQGVDQLPPDTGMWFIFPESRELSFWMKDTLIPLDILFVDEDYRIVALYKNVPPCAELDPMQQDCPSYVSNGPVRFVLELAGGTAQEKGIRVGDRLR